MKDLTREEGIKIKRKITLAYTAKQASEEFYRHSEVELLKIGMANAKLEGAKIGRPHTTKDDIPQVFYKHYPAYKSGQLNTSEFARVCDMSRTTIYKYVSLLEN